ncbi:MAG: class I SAM-dependent methyltransferase [Nitrospirae bacterium]|nr:class I SAM-dependent methyltransferase [Nitrospirota bacterium]
MTVFKKGYARFYDAFYQDKDYERECDFIEAAFKKNGCRVKTILDLGCGTGGHALILSRRGYQVVGIDRSREMIRIARRKAKEEAKGNKKKSSAEFYQGDITGIRLRRKFDAVISMFAVMGYQTTNASIAAACGVAASHLVSGGLFIFDCWHGNAVLTERPGMRMKEIVMHKGKGGGNRGEKRIIRFSEPVLDPLSHTVETRFRVLRIEGDRLVGETQESHLLRYLFPQEIRYYLETAGFRVLELCPFPELNKPLTEHDWNMAVIAGKQASLLKG